MHGQHHIKSAYKPFEVSLLGFALFAVLKRQNSSLNLRHDFRIQITISDGKADLFNKLQNTAVLLYV